MPKVRPYKDMPVEEELIVKLKFELPSFIVGFIEH